MDLSTGAIGSIISKLAELLKEEYKLQKGVKDQVESLTLELKSAQAFLEDIDKVPPDQLDKQVELYASEVREASYDMEDVLDTFLVRVRGPETIKKKQKKKLVMWLREKMDSFFGKTVARHGIAGAINHINKRLQEVTERRGRYTTDSCVTRPSPSSVVDPRLAAMYKQATHLIGIERPRDELASFLSSKGNEMCEKQLKIVSVVGIGGLGKTTLAKALYDNLKAQFNCWAFVPVGRNPDMKKVFRDILIELDKNKYMDPKFTTLDERQLINELQVFLERKRYFIVIDDVWDTKSWKAISLALVDNNIGSRIIITTRQLDVAMGEVYQLQPLSNDSSKKLLYTRIFGGEDKCPNNQRQKVSEVADKILKKCGGVPLAIITIASYLVGKSMGEWLEMCKSIGFCGKDKEQTGDTMWILSLSYYDLPSHLKTCLLYLSVFPEDYLIRKNTLIWMWIGEGFVNGKLGTGLFEIGEGYFNDLINRSLIQPVKDEMSRMIEGCRVHDMILDLICSLSCKANFDIISENGEHRILGSNARRLALQNRVVKDTPHDKHNEDKSRARSLIAIRCRFGSRVMLQSFKLLRVLFLEDCPDVHFDEHVKHLNLLRCLGVCNADSWKLPKDLGALKFLQVLYLQNNAFPKTWQLPPSVGMLTQLVCLRASGIRLPGGIIKELTSLQELEIHSCGGRDDDKSTGQFVKDLGNLCELRVLITLIHRMDERMQSDFFNSLVNLRKLQCLRLHFGYKIKIDAATWDKGLPLLPQGLCQLDIPVAGSVLPACIDPSLLPNLSHLSLHMDALDDQGLKILGGLPELCYLELDISRYHRATLTSTVARVYFQKLRSCCLIDSSMLQFEVNEGDMSVSFYDIYDPRAFGSKKVQDSCRVEWAVMPNLEALFFSVDGTAKYGRYDNLGLEFLASLQKVKVWMHYSNYSKSSVKAALRHAIQAHPNRPTLEIEYFAPYPVVSLPDDDDLPKEEEEKVFSTCTDDVTQSRSSDQEEEAKTARDDSP